MSWDVGDRVMVRLQPSGETCHGEITELGGGPGLYYVKLDKEYTHFDDDDLVICTIDELEPEEEGR